MNYKSIFGRRIKSSRARYRRPRRTSVTAHYLTHKESARELIVAKLNRYNAFYDYQWNRVAVRNQKSCWGSCTSLKNLNFSYKILFLPEHLQDYIIVHELCHLKELNHGRKFWSLVTQTLPDYKNYMTELRTLEESGFTMKQSVITMRTKNK